MRLTITQSVVTFTDAPTIGVCHLPLRKQPISHNIELVNLVSQAPVGVGVGVTTESFISYWQTADYAGFLLFLSNLHLLCRPRHCVRIVLTTGA